MSTFYQGNPANVSASLTATINGATNATPIVISTVSAHLFSTGDKVFVSGVLGNTAANGTWTITVIDATHFSLSTSVGSGAYTSGGTAFNQFLTPPITIPSDGDTFNAAAFNVAFQGLADRTQFLGKQVALKSATFTANGNWTSPSGCLFAILVGYGGGGGGGGGWPGVAGGLVALGGGGGGGARQGIQIVPITPNTTYAILIGAGGAGGSGVAGSNGNVTSFGGALATFPGGGGGQWALTNDPSGFDGDSLYTLGGNSTASAANSLILGAKGWQEVKAAAPTLGSGYGGLGGTSGVVPTAVAGHAGSSGMTSETGFLGGVAGAGGSAGTTSNGGGGGGGGGGGVGGAGGNGGAGGTGGTGAPTSGTAGSSASANSGAGGGGGGAGGSSSATTGAVGGAGGSGQLTIYYLAVA